LHHPAGGKRSLGDFLNGFIEAERTGPLMKHQLGEHKEEPGPDEQERQNNAE
jgi:hypothetical protein